MKFILVCIALLAGGFPARHRESLEKSRAEMGASSEAGIGVFQVLKEMESGSCQ